MLFRILLVLFTSFLGAVEPPCALEVMEIATTELPHCGILKNAGGFIYVDVDDAYIHTLVSFLEEEGFEAPPYFFEGGVGAHITVITNEEGKKYGVGCIEECGQVISFTPLHVEIVHPAQLKVDEVYLITVDAPQIGEIRKKYGLPKQTYAPHITIAVKTYKRAAIAARSGMISEGVFTATALGGCA